MNTFATIKLLKPFSFNKVWYYTVQIEGNQVDEFRDFTGRFKDDPEYQDNYQHILSWIKRIGEKIGAKQNYFRHEGASEALPPSKKFQQKEALNYLENELDQYNTLRLYCLRITDEVVILFNGGIKTTQSAQESPGLKKYFDQGNKLSKIITQKIKDQEIEIEGKVIKNLESIEIEL